MSTPHPTPPPTAPRATCRRVPMSKWRLKGFVEDSDKEDEDLESLGASSRRESQNASSPRVAHGTTEAESTAEREEGGLEHLRRGNENHDGTAVCMPRTPETRPPPKRPTPSPITPLLYNAVASRTSGIETPSTLHHRSERTESPDPLQSSSAQATQQHIERLQASSQSLGVPYLSQPLSREDQKSVGEALSVDRILVEFGIAPLSDSSQSDVLSDPPSDLDDQPEPAHNGNTRFSSPQRHTTVQVVIPRSTAIQRQYEEQEMRRALRARKPIQEHPYLIEAERYRRECQRRGIKPVVRAQSPVRKQGHHDQETQEQDFDPENDPAPSSPTEIPVSTPEVRRPRKDGHTHSARRPISSMARRRAVLAGSHGLSLVKRRRVEQSFREATASAGRVVGKADDTVGNIWSIPKSPPYSSSPPLVGVSSTRPRLPNHPVRTPAPNLPTPSHSSTPQGDAQADTNSDSDSEPVLRTALRSSTQIRPSATIASHNSSEFSSSEADPGDLEIRRVGKKIKGVLPASWLRIDRQAQAKRNAQARDQRNDTQFPEKPEHQRGVAQRITNNAHRAPKPVGHGDLIPDVVALSDSDASDAEVALVLNRQADVERSAQSAAKVAAFFDGRYIDDDSDNMENDRLHLFTLGDPSRKRKRQTKLTDTFTNNQKRLRISRHSTNDPIAPRHVAPRSAGNPKHTTSRRKSAPTPPPPLSILDADQSPSDMDLPTPQFLRLARRQARLRPDLGRQDLSNKYVRLQTACDTDDARVVLREWRSGALKPRADIELSRHPQPAEERQPLSEVVDNQQRGSATQGAVTASTRAAQYTKSCRKQAEKTQKRSQLPPNLLIFRRHPCSPVGTSKDETLLLKAPRQSSSFIPRKLRVAQLEGSETDLRSSDRRAAFHQGLRRVEQQFNFQLPFPQPATNPQLARFLADAVTTLSPLPSARHTGQEGKLSSIKLPPVPRRRLKRKGTPRRVDSETIEYRQPSEPLPQDDIFSQPVEQSHVFELNEGKAHSEQPILQGLGPCRARYPTTFDVTPLELGTFFLAPKGNDARPPTFIGSGELRAALRTGARDARDLNEPAGYLTIDYATETFRCGPWDEQTSSRITDIIDTIWLPLHTDSLRDAQLASMREDVFRESSKILRLLINYISKKLSFFDTIDRQSFASRMKHHIDSLLNWLLETGVLNSEVAPPPSTELEGLRTSTYLLVLTFQIRQISHHALVDPAIHRELELTITNLANVIVMKLLRTTAQLRDFLNQNKRYMVREGGIQDSDILVECLVVTQHVLATAAIPGSTFWDVVNRQLSSRVELAIHVKDFDLLWNILFTLLPFGEFDTSGILVPNQRASFNNDNWSFIRDLLRRLYALCPSTSGFHSASVNDYIRATLTRCHVLIHFWHWRRCDAALTVIFDFFAKNGLRPLRREQCHGSPEFLDDLTGGARLTTTPKDTSFHIFLKCLAMGLQGMRHSYTEKKIRSIIFRLTPNHGRSYPKDQGLPRESLDALRNHHDLLCTLYWASPPSCRPRLDLIRGLVDHQTSHREACRLNVRAWANLTAYQLSTDEPYESSRPFAEWHKEILQQTLQQYRLAKSEAEDYLKSGALEENGTVSLMVRQTIEKNQEQVIATLRDCIAGMQNAIQTAVKRAENSMQLGPGQTSLGDFLMDSGLIQLLELPHLEDRRLVVVIRETLTVLRMYAKLQKGLSSKQVSQPTSEESQDYGEFPDWEEIRVVDQPIRDPPVDFIQKSLWRLLSNAFGADNSPDDNLLMDCVDTWAHVARLQVSTGRHWSSYVGNSESHHSWQQLRRTEQTRIFRPYFMATVIVCDATAYKMHCNEFFKTLLVSLVDRESMFRFQYRLLHAMARTDPSHPLLKNLPFFRLHDTNEFDITSETVRTRRLPLISSLLANMRDHLRNTTENQEGVKEEYVAILSELMAAMRSNYEELRRGNTVIGAYVEFVHKIVQFLQQYTSDICAVSKYFTNDVAFPLPTMDPTYLVGRLCSYAPNVSDVKVAKQLSAFFQTVSQQATIDNQQSYLVNQLRLALCTDETVAEDRGALRSLFLQGIFPAYIEEAFASLAGFTIAMPILQSLHCIFGALTFDLRILDDSNLREVHGSILSISHAFIRSTEQIKGDALRLREPYVLCAVAFAFRAMTPIISLIDYIKGRTSTSTSEPKIVRYLGQLGVFITETVQRRAPQEVPSYNGDAHASCFAYSDLASFVANGLASEIKAHWSMTGDSVFFGRGHSRKEVVLDLGSYEEEKARLIAAIEAFRRDLAAVYDYNGEGRHERELLGDVEV